MVFTPYLPKILFIIYCYLLLMYIKLLYLPLIQLKQKYLYIFVA